MLLAIDRGNTNEKFVIFDGGKIVFDSAEIITDKNSLITHISEIITHFNFSVSDCVFSSVRSEAENTLFIEEISKICRTKQITSTTELPFVSLYKSSTIGIDRLCAVAGANALYGSNVLVVDAGTCITFDYLDKDKRYLGGSISPGFQIKYKALHNFTANLPLISRIEEMDFVANTTEGCIASGVICGTIAETEQTINLYKQRFSDVKIVITGGDGAFIKSRIHHDVTEEKNLVFWGLKNIYEFNEKSNK